jgi:hypothetical protein
LGKHIIRIHKITTKEYFNSFLKKENDGLCLTCKNPTFFQGLNLGYRKYCSQKCLANNKNIIEKRNNTNLKRYGFINPAQNFEIKQKSIETLFKNYGVENPSQSKEIQKRKEKTCLMHYGVNNPSKSLEVLLKKTKKNDKVLSILGKNKIELIEYIERDFINCKCANNHIFTIRTHYLYLKDRKNVGICPICFPKNEFSNLEKQLLDFIKQQNYQVLENNRDIIKPYELDIYLPDLKLAFEFNGLYWHNEINKQNNYHLIKTIKCEKKGIHLIHIYEDDWLYKQDIIKSRILNLLGKSEKIMARKCLIKEVQFKESKAFLEKNHIQGSSFEDRKSVV